MSKLWHEWLTNLIRHSEGKPFITFTVVYLKIGFRFLSLSLFFLENATTKTRLISKQNNYTSQRSCSPYFKIFFFFLFEEMAYRAVIPGPLCSFQMGKLSGCSYYTLFLPKLTKMVTEELVNEPETRWVPRGENLHTLTYLQPWQPALATPSCMFAIFQNPSSSKPIKYMNTLTQWGEYRYKNFFPNSQKDQFS